jgi:hypothetical protein
MFICNGKKYLFFCAVIVFVVLFFLPLAAQKKGIVLEEIKIEGTIQKPEAMYFLSRARFTYRTLDLSVSFKKKVEKALYTEDAF